MLFFNFNTSESEKGEVIFLAKKELEARMGSKSVSSNIEGLLPFL